MYYKLYFLFQTQLNNVQKSPRSLFKIILHKNEATDFIRRQFIPVESS